MQSKQLWGAYNLPSVWQGVWGTHICRVTKWTCPSVVSQWPSKLSRPLPSTHIQLTDSAGQSMVRTSCGTEGFKNIKKSTPVAAQTAGIAAATVSHHTLLLTLTVRGQVHRVAQRICLFNRSVTLLSKQDPHLFEINKHQQRPHPAFSLCVTTCNLWILNACCK